MIGLKVEVLHSLADAWSGRDVLLSHLSSVARAIPFPSHVLVGCHILQNQSILEKPKADQCDAEYA